MKYDLPFEPIDAFEHLYDALPPISIGLSRADLRSLIVHGFITKRLIYRGRFEPFGFTCAVRSEYDTTAKALLDSSIPPNSKEPLYASDAYGCTARSCPIPRPFAHT